jgi:tRNA/rRNA methyltransferase
MTIRIILLEPESSGNIGSVARSMKNFDQHDLWIVNPKTAIDIDARACAMHGFDVLSSAKIVKQLDEALVGVDIVAATSAVAAKSSTNITRTPMTPKELAYALRSLHGKVALIFGRESSGLSNQEIERCDLLVMIPASYLYNVLNLAIAVSIILYEIFQQPRGSNEQFLATNATRRKLLEEFERLVNMSGTQPHKRKLAIRAFRNLISRSFVSRREASLLIGVFRKTISKTSSQESRRLSNCKLK